jgi:hypothetical protein
MEKVKGIKVNTKGKYSKSILNRWYLLLVFEKLNPSRFNEMKKDKTLIPYIDFIEGIVRGLVKGDLEMRAGGKEFITISKNK